MLKRKVLKIILAASIFITIGTLSIINIFTKSIGKDCAESMLYANKGIDTIQNSIDTMAMRGFDIEKFESERTPDKILIPTDDGYQIPASLFKYSGDINNDTVILLHGQSGDRSSTYDAAEFFLSSGFNVLAIDQRGSGQSEFEYITFGYLEKNDLLSCVDYIRRSAPLKRIGCYGQSMGAATIGLYLGTAHSQENIDFAIMDSSYDNMTSMLLAGLEAVGQDIPVNIVSEWCNGYLLKNYGFRLQDVNIVDAMKANIVPTLIIQGIRDELCTPDMGKRIFDALPPENLHSELWMIDSPHVRGIVEEYDNYRNMLSKFINQSL